MAKTHPVNAGGLGSSLGQGTRSHMWQLKTVGAAAKTGDPLCAESKIWCSQVCLLFFFFNFYFYFILLYSTVLFLFFFFLRASFALKILKNTQGASVSIQDE